MKKEKIKDIIVRKIKDDEKRRREDFVIEKRGSFEDMRSKIEEIIKGLRGKNEEEKR